MFTINIKPPAPKPVTTFDKNPKNPFSKGPVQFWNVTTEGDVEGRSTKNLGNFYGHVCEIAFYLADKCCYSLWFNPVSGGAHIPEHFQATSKSVAISLHINSGTWNFNPAQRRLWFEKWLDLDPTSNILVKEGQYYASVLLELK